MKKSIVFVVAATLLAVFLLASCTTPSPSDSPSTGPEGAGQADGGKGVANPIKESSRQEILDELGISFAIPARAENSSYQIIQGEEATAQAKFTLDGAGVTYRIQPASAFTDISGVNAEWESEAAVSIKYLTGEARFNKGAEGVCLWYDTVPGLMYCVYVETGAAEESLKSIANELFVPMQGDAQPEPAPFTGKDAGELFSALKTVGDCLFLANDYAYEASYFDADGSLHFDCYDFDDESKRTVFSFYTTEYSPAEGGEAFDLTEEVREMKARVTYIDYSVIGFNAIRGLYIGSTMDEVLAAFPNRGSATSGELYNVTLLNPQADVSWGNIGEKTGIAGGKGIIGGQTYIDEKGRTQIIYVYSDVKGPDDWLQYHVLTFTLGKDNKVSNIEYEYFTDAE
jgi:hypothetical protein